MPPAYLTEGIILNKKMLLNREMDVSKDLCKSMLADTDAQGFEWRGTKPAYVCLDSH